MASPLSTFVYLSGKWLFFIEVSVHKCGKMSFPKQNTIFDIWIALFQSGFFYTVTIKTVPMAEFLCMHA